MYFIKKPFVTFLSASIAVRIFSAFNASIRLLRSSNEKGLTRVRDAIFGTNGIPANGTATGCMISSAST